jgi:hypothetical protein
MSLADLEKSLAEKFNLKAKPKTWVLPNRVQFPTWLDVTFKYSAPPNIETTNGDCECDTVKCKSQVASLHLFPHQQLVVDYMQFASPYRGILLYHSLGSGKSATSIAAAELLSNYMQVVVMTPASLRGNYVEEIKKYGRQYYSPQQKWLFMPLNTKDTAAVGELADRVQVPMALIKKHKGLYIPHKTSRDAKLFSTFDEVTRRQIEEQIEASITERIAFVSYNGLNKKKIEEMVTNDGNPFDNKCVVIDEIHNLISRVVNKSVIGKALYKLLYNAKNCKLILLSGTPVINYPHEIACIVNLITGPRTMYEVALKKNVSIDALRSVLSGSKYIDRFNVEPNAQKVSFDFLPEGFEFTDRPRVSRTKGSDIKLHTDILAEILVQFKNKDIEISKNPVFKQGESLPSDEEEFNKYFVDVEAGEFYKQDIFMKRILGTVSYYRTFDSDLFPSVQREDVKVAMTDYQFSVYEKSRGEERRKEQLSKGKKSTGDNIFKNTGQVYRFYSRANCNFVFPESIQRPFPSSNHVITKEIDFMAEEEKDTYNNEEDVKLLSKRDFTAEYQKKLTKALAQLDGERNKHLSIEALQTLYSPKFAEVVQRLRKCTGTALIYSQFRTVEGLGVLSMALKADGWAEFKIKKTTSGWSLDVNANDLDKPMFAMFTGNNDESSMLLKIFNNDLDNVPDVIKSNLGEANNLRGKLLKALMITQSGAEGLSLKNVRHVHVLEPYWNHIRIDQVIGRAVRTCSHLSLPPNERNVTVYQYRTVLTDKQLKNSFTLRTQDKSMTTDEYIHDIAERKSKIIMKMMDYVQKSSVDCALNAKYHKNIRCFSYPVNMKPEHIATEFEIARDKELTGVHKKEWSGQVLLTKKGNFIVDPATQVVYDYDLYVEAGRLVKIGTMKVSDDGKSRQIVGE